MPYRQVGSLRRVFVAALLLCGLASGDSFYSFGPDAMGVGRVFSAVPGGIPAFALGDGSLAFNGGLVAISDHRFYAIANDPSGNSILQTFTLAGPSSLSAVAALAAGFNGGLAYDATAQNLYAISNDSIGNSSLSRIDLAGNVTPLGAIGAGFYGGLTFNATTGLLYGFQGDFTGAQRVFTSITPGAGPTVNPLFALGDGSYSFSGGVAYDPTDGLFYAISSDIFGNSRLNAFDLTGESSLDTVAANIGAGYVNVGLTSAADVPEPSSLVCLGAAVAVTFGFTATRQRRERKRALSR